MQQGEVGVAAIFT